ncbi:MAG: bifunctional oligoribonuclease/PAP phosphatase NrnA [Nitrospirae bacterium]|nr:bifunctional oligoribonuclease/PAP phosphatase NrnA [Nitrospirota bacterium]
MKVPVEIITLLKKEEKFLIMTHINPDGDAIGSSTALSLALGSVGKETLLYDRDPVPQFYRFLPGYERFTNSISSLVTGHWSLILLDCNSPERAGIDNLTFKHSIVIDHHETERDFGDIRWMDTETAATGLMVFYLIKELGIKITRDIAINLYSAISIDTGTFRYSNTTPEVLRVGAELIEAGANPYYISNSLYETWSGGRFDLLIRALNTLEIRDDIAITTVTKEMFIKTRTGPEDTENFSNFPRMIQSVRISALFREIDTGLWKVSLRSKGDVNVARIAELFDGGGHKNAAGYKIKADLESAKEALLKAVNGYCHKSQQT